MIYLLPILAAAFVIARNRYQRRKQVARGMEIVREHMGPRP